jgi:hypothetical protein
VSDTVHSRVLQRAAEALGGVDQLVLCLGVSKAQLGAWMQGRGKPPDAVFLKLADALADRNLLALRGPATAED